jgi:ribonuclease PH
MGKRVDGRKEYEIRKPKFILDYLKYPWGSCLAIAGQTKVLCAATFQRKVPNFLLGTGSGWITAEYSLLPTATHERTNREAALGKLTGRTQEIQRFLGRALRSVCDLTALGENQIIIDCDVIQADGGTRTVALNGAFLALKRCIERLLQEKIIAQDPIKEFLGAISVGLVDDKILVDLSYEEDHKAQVDMNVVLTEDNKIVELQLTAERQPLHKNKFYKMLKAAERAIAEITRIEKAALKNKRP